MIHANQTQPQAKLSKSSAQDAAFADMQASGLAVPILFMENIPENVVNLEPGMTMLQDPKGSGDYSNLPYEPGRRMFVR